MSEPETFVSPPSSAASDASPPGSPAASRPPEEPSPLRRVRPAPLSPSATAATKAVDGSGGTTNGSPLIMSPPMPLSPSESMCSVPRTPSRRAAPASPRVAPSSVRPAVPSSRPAPPSPTAALNGSRGTPPPVARFHRQTQASGPRDADLAAVLLNDSPDAPVHPISHFRAQAAGDVARVIPGRASSVAACIEVLRAYPVAEAGFLLALREILAGVPNAAALGVAEAAPCLPALTDDGPREPLALAPTPHTPAPHSNNSSQATGRVGLSPSRRSRSHERYDAKPSAPSPAAETERALSPDEDAESVAAAEEPSEATEAACCTATSPCDDAVAREEGGGSASAEPCASGPRTSAPLCQRSDGSLISSETVATSEAAVAKDDSGEPQPARQEQRTEPPPLMRPAYHVPKWRQEQRRREQEEKEEKEAAAAAETQQRARGLSPDLVAVGPSPDPFFVTEATTSGAPVPVRPARPPSPDARLLDPMDDEGPSPSRPQPLTSRRHPQRQLLVEQAMSGPGPGERRDDPVDPLRWEGGAAGLVPAPTTRPGAATSRVKAAVFVPGPRARSESEGRRPRTEPQHTATERAAQGLSCETSRMLASLRMARSRTPPTSTTPSRGVRRR